MVRIDQQRNNRKIAQVIEYYKEQGFDLTEEEVHNLKFIHKKVVFISGMDPRLMKRTDLDTEKYFGQYGKVMSLTFKQETGNLHVVYENKKQASFAIIALTDYNSNKKSNQQQLKVYFGTSKFCLSFLRDQKCRKHNCQFIHELKKSNQIFTKNKLSLSSAYRTAQKSQTYLKKQIDSTSNDYTVFPKIREVEQKVKDRLRNRQNTQKKGGQLEINRSYNHSNNSQHLLKSEWDQSDIDSNQQTNISSQNQQQTNALSRCQTGIEDNNLHILNSNDDMLEERNINQIIVKRLLYGKIRNHKSRFEFAQE